MYCFIKTIDKGARWHDEENIHRKIWAKNVNHLKYEFSFYIEASMQYRMVI